jgi:cephalosporin hydroxylase
MKGIDRFTGWLKAESDIHDHLQFIYDTSHGMVLELGIRSGVSTSALLAGIETDGEEGSLVVSVDTNKRCYEVFRGHPQWLFINCASTDFHEIETAILETGHPVVFNLILIDTLHSLEQVSQELKTWAPFLKAEGKILVHDVITYASGAGKACEQFAKFEKWKYQVREGSNGLGILTKE